MGITNPLRETEHNPAGPPPEYVPEPTPSESPAEQPEPAPVYTRHASVA